MSCVFQRLQQAPSHCQNGLDEWLAVLLSPPVAAGELMLPGCTPVVRSPLMALCVPIGSRKGGGSFWWYSRMPSGSHRWGDQAVPNATPHFHTYRLSGWGLSRVSGQAKRWEEGLCGPTCMHVENGFHLSLLPPAPRFEWYSLASLVRGQPDISRHHYCTKRALGSFLSLCPLLFPFGLGVKGPLSRGF